MPRKRTLGLVFGGLMACDASPVRVDPAPPSDAAEGSVATPEEPAAPTASPVPTPAPSPLVCGELRRVEAGRCVADCPASMVYVPPTGADGFMMGRNYMNERHPNARFGKGHRPNTDLPHRVKLTRPFCMDRYEVTVKQWSQCMTEKVCPVPDIEHRFVTWPDHLDHPVNAVDWYGARAYCERLGKTLPTEAQFEWAATGGDGRVYPWGNEPADCTRADYVPGVLAAPAGDSGCHGGGPSPVGSHPAGARHWPDGAIFDLAGNVWEWCLDNFSAYAAGTSVDPLDWRGEDLQHVVRGGGWNRSHVGIKAAFRGAAVADYKVPGLGFRCVKNP